MVDTKEIGGAGSPDRKRKIYQKQVDEVVKEFEGIQQYQLDRY